MSRRVSRALVFLLLAMVVSAGKTTHAYLKLGTTVNGQTVDVKWPARTPVRYYVNDGSVPGVTAAQFRDAVGRAFTTWEDVPTSSVSFQFVGFVGSQPLDEDGISVLGFASRPDLERTLASTNFVVDTRTGEVIESDIFFNAAFPWSTSESGTDGRYDVQSVVTHEAGHFLGLGHSALGETEVRPGGGRRLIASAAVMFPIAFSAGNIVDRRLTADDIAGASDVYPDDDFRGTTGTLQGTVTKGGKGVFGAHLVAFNIRTGSLVGGFSLDDSGTFAIGGLPSGTYILRIEPLDDGDTESFFDASSRVDTGFAATYYRNLVTVPRGSGSVKVAVTVTAK
jgi:hypothetical protein